MITLSKLRPWVAGAILLGAAGAAQAGSVGGYSACGTASFGTYAASGYRCTVGAVDLFNFELYTVNATGVATLAPGGIAGIYVDPTWNPSTGIADILVGGFTGMGVDAAHTAAWMIRFTVDPPPVLSGEDIYLDPPAGTILGTQQYCGDGLFTSPGVCGSTSGPSGTTTFGIGSPASLRFSSPLMTLDTYTTIRLNPGFSVASSFDGVVFRILTTEGTGETVTPEPSGWLLMASGLVLVTGRSLRRQKPGSRP